MVGLLLEKYKLPDNCLKIVPLGNTAGIKYALAMEQVDSAILPPVAAYPLEKGKKGHIIGYVGRETPFQVAAVFSSSKFLKKNEELMSRFLKGCIQGYRFYHRVFNREPATNYNAHIKLSKNEERYKSAITMSQYLQAVTPLQISSYPIYLDPDGKLDIDSVKNQLRWYQQRKMVNKDISINEIIAWNMVKILNAAAIK